MPMISLDDYLGATSWAGVTGFVQGPYNLTVPEPTTNAAFTDALAGALHRPRVLRVPAVVLRTALGELAEQLVGDCWAVPQRLTRDGYVFADPDVHAVIASALRT
jgi:NAD dependent epimerase/dehydratase family enzyme